MYSKSNTFRGNLVTTKATKSSKIVKDARILPNSMQFRTDYWLVFFNEVTLEMRRSYLYLYSLSPRLNQYFLWIQLTCFFVYTNHYHVITCNSREDIKTRNVFLADAKSTPSTFICLLL